MKGKLMYIWLILAAFCLVYYGICASYAGTGSSFIFVWLVAAAGCILIFLSLKIIKTYHINIPVWIRITCISIFCIGIAYFVVIESLIVSKMLGKPQQNCEYIIILGAQIRGKVITNSLKKRLDTAYDYIAANPDVKVIVSGGKGPGEDVSEASAMKEYLIGRGIPGNKIIMEDRSKNTNENIINSLQFIEDKNASVGIVSNNFHIYRALRLAKAKGLTNPTGIPSPSDRILFINYMVREAIGVTKDMIMGNF